MSSGQVTSQTSNQLFVDIDTSKIFVWNNEYYRDTFLNNTGAQASFAAGTLLGRITASGKLAICKSGAVDGSQIPVGILKTSITDLADAGEVDVNYCIYGKVVESKVVLDGTDTLATMISGRTIKDRIAADTAGIILVDGDELTEFDNQ